MSAQRALFTEDGEDVQLRVNDLLGRAFELHCEADDINVPGWWGPDDSENPARDVEQHPAAIRRAQLRAKAARLEAEADRIVPVEERTWLR
jgi:hypothetical protein